MDMLERRYIVGIDLGTTNSAVSWIDTTAGGKKERGIRLFDIPQLTSAGEISSLPVLPSFYYIPGKYDIHEDAIRLPWHPQVSHVVGTFAREQGASVPARLVSSSKSWLCHAGADRQAKILPWGASLEEGKVSPVQASAAYLDHIRRAWNSRVKDEDGLLENQLLVITVPASFDEVARDLTIEAAKTAGLSDAVLLEEPLSAFYSWLVMHEQDWHNHIQPGELVLVCDVGGGTTDLTLITLTETGGQTPRFERIAVGEHLILGGDNIDLALARQVEIQFGTNASLSADRWKTLCHLCRQAKENILNGRMESETITLMGEGSRLIGGTLTARIDSEMLDRIVSEGFFPLVEKSETPSPFPKKGISEFGLPYAQEPAITRHIGNFLENHRKDIETFLGPREPFPDLVLFNGGSLKAEAIRERVCEAIRHWFGKTDENHPRVLETKSLDLAVAHGAAYYGLVKTGRGVRVGSGSPRSYYLGIAHGAASEENAAETQKAVCIVERGLDEGSRMSLENMTFDVLTNQPVSFDLYSSSYRSGDRFGDIVFIDDTFTPLPPLQTVIQFGKKGAKTAIAVTVEVEYTESGVLMLWCSAVATGHKWQLRFQLRDSASRSPIADREVLDADHLSDVLSIVSEAFQKDAPKDALAGLVKSISKCAGRGRDDWSLGLIRNIADLLLEKTESRKFSSEHEVRWLNLVGFCLRPGFGDGFDEQRIKTLWKIYKSGVVFRKNQQALVEWWIMWRRVAGGLTAGQQRQFSQDLRPVLLPKKGGKVRTPGQERMEMFMAIANMERLAIKEKMAWGRVLISEINPKKARMQHLWCLSRIGARDLLYGPVDRVLPPEEAAKWLEWMLAQTWNQTVPAGDAMVQMGRKTGDRARDIDAALASRVSAWLEEHGMPEKAGPLKEIVALKKQEESAIFGESLPSGLILREA
ncbi:MAG: Hsp70 family protein [Desulfosalsimonadaceae bacterium]